MLALDGIVKGERIRPADHCPECPGELDSIIDRGMYADWDWDRERKP